MAINSAAPNSNPQLSGILASTPSIASTPLPSTSAIVGGIDLITGAQFTVPTSPVPTTPPAAGQTGTGTLVVGGGTTPAAGAQPAAPAGVTDVTTNIVPTTTAPVTAATTTTTTTTPASTSSVSGGGMTIEASGFGKAERNQPINVSVGGATFGFPSFNSTAKTNGAPAISWGPGWSKVEKDGMWFMEHTNGVKAIPAVEYRITPNPAGKVSTVKVANGWGKKFPDGTILVFDRKEGPYRLDPQGNKHKVGLGTHTFGGVKVRVFEASVVRTLDKDGGVNVFDSRGNRSEGSKRGRLAAALGAANAGASTSGGGKTDSGPVTASGPGGKDGTLVGSGSGAVTTAQMTQDVQRITEIARGLVAEIRSGNVDGAKLASLQAQLNALPSGILQAAGAAGTITSDGRSLRHAGETHEATPADGGTPPGSTVASVGGGGAPIAGVDANATTKTLAAGAKAKVEGAIPAELQGKQARFAQLPDEIQMAVAKAFGSDQGAAAFKADQLVAFNANGEVSLVEGGTVYVKHQAQVRGAGPGEEIALTVRPGRQPGGTGRTNVTLSPRPAVQGGGGAHANKPMPTAPSVPGVAVSGGGATSNRITLFAAGSETRDVEFGGLNGSYTWASLPAKAREAIKAQLNNPSTAAGKAFASRTGTGWSVDPGAVIVLDAGFASFINGLTLTRSSSGATTRPAAAPVAGGGPSSNAIGHDARRPPVSGGGGVGAVSPGTPPPVPVGSGGGSHVGH